MLQPIESIPPTHIELGGVKLLASAVKQLGGKSVFLITDKGLVQAGLAEKVAKIARDAKLPVEIFDDVLANPTSDVIDEGAKRLKKVEIKPCICVLLGGGSTMDAGKAIAMLAGQPEDGGGILNYCMMPELKKEAAKVNGIMHHYPINGRSLATKQAAKPGSAYKYIALPTTSGTASETNGGAVVTDPSTQRKLICYSPESKASLIILDAELTIGVPAYPTATCGMDVLTHSLEALTSSKQNPYSDSIALGAIKLVAHNLPVLMKDLSNMKARQNMHLASYMAGVAFNIAGLGICHAMGHPLSSMYHQAHGQTLATLLPHVMKFHLEIRADKFTEVAKAFGVHDATLSEKDNAERAVDAVAALSREVGTARSVRTLGGKKEDLPTLVQQALTDIQIITTPRPPTRQEVEALYLAAFDDETLYGPTSKL